MSNKAFENLWAIIAGAFAVAVAHMVALSQGWAWTIGIELERPEDTGPVVKTVAAYIGAPICLVLAITCFYLSRHYYLRHGRKQGRWQRLPVPWDIAIPSTDPIGKKYRFLVWVLIFLLCPYGTGHLVRKTFEGSLWLKCEVAESVSSLAPEQCDALEADAIAGKARTHVQYVALEENWKSHFSIPTTRDYFGYRYRFGDSRGYEYFPLLHPILLIVLSAWALVELALVWWRLLG